MASSFSPETPNRNAPYGQAAILILMSLFWIPFLFSAKSYIHVSWFEYLFLSRCVFFLVPIPVALYLIITRKEIGGFISYYYLLAMAVQASHGALEPSDQNDFYSYTSLFLLLSSLSYKGNFKNWVKYFAPIILLAHTLPLFTKDASFFTSIGHFVDKFSFSVALLIFSLIILRISIGKYKIFEDNICLQRQLLEEKEQRIRLVEMQLRSAQGQIEKRTKLVVMGEIASQVAHDIRSPLAALDSAAKDVTELPEEKRIIMRSAIARIRDIANCLLEKHKQTPQAISDASHDTLIPAKHRDEKVRVWLLSSLIDPLITEKRLQFGSRRTVEINTSRNVSSYGLFARVAPNEFKRVLSNLINNSVEAFGEREKGSIIITLSQENGDAAVEIKDNGNGIPEEVLSKLGQRGETHGKSEGSGLGLYHARTSLESWGGSLKIDSEIGKGTAVTLILPKAEPPKWFVERLDLAPQTHIIVLDDDQSIHLLWQGRFDSLKAREQGVELVHCHKPDELRDWVRKNRGALYLVDYELLGYKETGLSLIEELGLAGNAILVTSRFEEKSILEECLRLNVRMIPKGLAGFVPISVKRETLNVKSEVKKDSADTSNVSRLTSHAVLIDDDPLVHMVWKMAAQEKGMDLKAFKDPKDFMKLLDKVGSDLSTPIYLDSELGEGVKGEDIAKELHDKGFTNLYLETGHPPEAFAHATWIKKVVGKEPPWV
ncbi:sensor histidine kinase [Elusimicrobiota bacterium]